MSKEHILSEIRRTAAANGGIALGRDKFAAETGIKPSDWLGKHWARWGDAVREAGLAPKEMQAARTDEDLLSHLAALVRSLGHFPVTNEIRMKARSDAGFPWHNTFAKFGSKAKLAARLQQYCLERGEGDIAEMCATIAQLKDEPTSDTQDLEARAVGYVYMVRHGARHEYKIGRTNNPLRREGELRIELPEVLTPIHKIETDDPAGIERYWHMRFSNKRKQGEWFELSAADVRAFRRWRNIY
jgi:Meiotically up-regulated gene 113